MRLHPPPCLPLFPLPNLGAYSLPLPAPLTAPARLSGSPTDNHWELRDYAAALVSHISLTYGHLYPTLTPRVAKTLLKAFLDPSKPHATQYGAIVGLWGLGTQVRETLVLPNVRVYGEGLRALLASSSSSAAASGPGVPMEGVEQQSQEAVDAGRVFQRVVNLLREYVKAQREAQAGGPELSRLEREWCAVFGIFAEDALAV